MDSFTTFDFHSNDDDDDDNDADVGSGVFGADGCRRDGVWDVILSSWSVIISCEYITYYDVVCTLNIAHCTSGSLLTGNNRDDVYRRKSYV